MDGHYSGSQPELTRETLDLAIEDLVAAEKVEILVVGSGLEIKPVRAEPK